MLGAVRKNVRRFLDGHTSGKDYRHWADIQRRYRMAFRQTDIPHGNGKQQEEKDKEGMRLVKVETGKNGYHLESEDGKQFLCRACLNELPVKQRAEDKRYCKLCHSLINEEIKPEEPPLSVPIQKLTTAPEHRVEPFANLQPYQSPTSPTNLQKTKAKKPCKRINRKKALPEELIKMLRDQGMKLGDIALELERQCGLEVSLWTVHRVLNGTRKQPMGMGI